jgi:hypothetical protein
MGKARTPFKTARAVSVTTPTATSPQRVDRPFVNEQTTRSGRKVRVKLSSFEGTAPYNEPVIGIGKSGTVYSGKKTLARAVRNGYAERL